MATYCFDTEETRDRFRQALENLLRGREWHEDAASRSRLVSLSNSCTDGGGSRESGSGDGGDSGGSGMYCCALPMAQVMADYSELMNVYKAFLSGKMPTQAYSKQNDTHTVLIYTHASTIELVRTVSAVKMQMKHTQYSHSWC